MPDWYRRAVFYSVFVGSFSDADNDGVGDLAGLASTLDYLAWLGVDCLWLLPFYPSPTRDGDFRSVGHEYGTLEDFTTLLAEAHRRGIRVMVDVVLNHDHPEVFADLLEAPRFWLDLGVDGIRLVTAGGESVADTHDVLRMVRKVVDDEYSGRIVLGEAGQQSHLTFHSPVLPKILLALRQESRQPVSEILGVMAESPPGGQWALSLRDHEELPLSMLSERERAALYQEYAPDPRMLLNGGIRRRLAALLGNDLNQQELLTALLLSLPGSPVLYYGDEIGMGDNIWLPDRDGLRTPMQWSPDRNAGFSRCDPGKLIQPVIANAVYGYQSVNVEAQQASPMSLLHWTRTMIAIRHRHPAFGLGDFTELTVSNPATMAYTRVYEGETLLCVFNFSRFPQPVRVSLPDQDGRSVLELTGQVKFPVVRGGNYQITLPGHGFYWFGMEDG